MSVSRTAKQEETITWYLNIYLVLRWRRTHLKFYDYFNYLFYTTFTIHHYFVVTNTKKDVSSS
jgi:hypothetical protein